MANYIFIHGSLSGGWCWSKVKKILENKGHKVIAPNLPGHEADSSIPFSDVTMERYVSFVRDIVESNNEKVILVGHSLGGAIISKVIDEITVDIIEKAYFVSALIPQNGDIIGKMLKADIASELPKAFRMNSDNMTIEFIWETVREIYYNGCSDEDFEFAKNRILPQSIIPFSTPIELGNLKVIRRIGIVSENDRSLTPDYQRYMYRKAMCEIRNIYSGHAPFFSKPAELVELILAE
ncbi:MAG TPA: hypothetical protein DCO75_07310 [Fibrobacteres bacterium]|nr:hypothetical protein [Fibrobacterota bacterium]